MINTPTLHLFVFLTIIILSGCSTGSPSTNSDVRNIANANQTLSQTFSSTIVSRGDEISENVCQLSILDETMLNLINEARSQERLCGDVHYESVTAVTWNCQLKGAAISHAEDMGDNNFFNHTGSDGLNVGHRVSATGYDWRRVGENIAARYDTEESVIQGWLASPEHCATVMDYNFIETAVSVYLPEGADYDTYWVMVMAK